ncbi:MAG: T9SS type A sorting domain-containing protein [Chitinophagales bacterium]
MKPNSYHAVLESCVLFLAALLIALAAGAQTPQAPIYKFKNPVLISGTGGQVNAVYRFPNVLTAGSGANMDALVKIQNKVGNITLVNIDRTADGYNEAFQPEFSVGASSNAYFDFQITFVLANTSTSASQPMVDVSALDVDGLDTLGYTLKEFNRVDMSGGVCSFNLMGSQLTISQTGGAFDGRNFTGILFGALVDTLAKEVMFSVSNTNVNSFTFRAGANNLFPAAMSRYASLYFKRFNYPQNVILSVRSLASFSGVSADNGRNLKWSLTDGNNATSVVLEKSFTGNSFLAVSEFRVNMDGNSQKELSYFDSKNAESLVYYRLKIIAKDGKVQYSNTLRFDSEKNDLSELAVYPSLVQSVTTLNYTSKEKQAAVIMVTDMSGRTVKQQNVLLQEGSNSIQVSGFDQYRKGNYFVSVISASQKSSKQIVVR